MQQKQEKQLNKLPTRVTKKDIKKMFPGINHDTLMEWVNDIIKTTRKTDKRHDSLLLKEFVLLLDITDTPHGYCDEFHDGSSWRDRLKKIKEHCKNDPNPQDEV